MGLTGTERLHAVLTGFSAQEVVHLDSFIQAPRCKGAGVAAGERGEGMRGRKLVATPRGWKKSRKAVQKMCRRVILPLSGR